ncbi:MAG TPA: class I SAM-dependent methyltransferase [Asanoa sp.]
MVVDEDRVTTLLDRVVADVGATLAAGNVVVGDRLGLYKALADGPQRPQELAARTGTAARYVEEWLRGQAASGYVAYDATAGAYSMTAEQVAVFADPDGEVHAPGAFRTALAGLRAEPHVTRAFRGDAPLRRDERDGNAGDYARYLDPRCPQDLLSRWIPALHGVEERLCAGARVADVGCGRGYLTLMMARAFPRSTFAGSDDRPAAVSRARRAASAALLDRRVGFEVAAPQSFSGGPYDLVTTFGILHDLGDPAGAARQVRRSAADGGTWLLVEPYAGRSVSENLTPVGRLFYALSAWHSVPRALSEPGCYSLGAQAGEEPVRKLVHDAGFTRFERVGETALSIAYAARP